MANKHSSFVDQYLSDRRDIPREDILVRANEKLIRTEYSLQTTLSKLPMRITALTKYPNNKKNNLNKLERVNKSIAVTRQAIERLNEVINRLKETKSGSHVSKPL